jgi:hypothetical protein
MATVAACSSYAWASAGASDHRVTRKRGKREGQDDARDSAKAGGPAPMSVLPMNLQVGDRFTAEGFEWKVVTRPRRDARREEFAGANRAAGRTGDRARHDLGGPRACYCPPSGAMNEVPLSRLPYLLPHVRVQRLVHTILATRWDAAIWPIAESQGGWRPPIRRRAVTLLTELDAFYLDHRRCGVLDGDADGATIWLACECGARMARRTDEGYRAGD